MQKVLFACMGNICRSPTAEVIFKRFVEQQKQTEMWQIDSAGTHAYHAGEPPDRRSQQAAKQRGYNMASQRARQVTSADFYGYDWILAMDRHNLALLEEMAPPDGRAKLRLILDFAQHKPWQGSNVPDPYYGGEQGFNDVLDKLEDACAGFLNTHASSCC